MHLQFYHLNRPPFQLATDSDFFWKGKNYDKSFEVLKYSLEHHGGLSLLTGNAGSGKSMVVRALLDALGGSVRSAVIPDSSLTGQEFYDLVAHGFNVPAGMERRRDFHDRIHALLREASQNNQQVLLVVDEAQQLSGQLIDEINELLNLQPLESGGLGVCLVGQADTAQALATRVGQAFEDHVIVRYHLAPFSLEDTGEYIEHRLHVAGSDRRIFSADAIREIHQCSGGFPGRINIICDLALFTGYTAQAAEIGPAVVRTSVAKLRFPGMEGESGDISSDVTPVDPGTENADPASDQKNEAVVATKDIADPVVAATAAGGRSFARPLFAVFVALVFAGAGYVVYTNSGTEKKVAEPAVVDTPPDVERTVFPVHETEKKKGDFDAVGYSVPEEDLFSLSQPVDGGAATPVVAADPAHPTAGDSAPKDSGRKFDEKTRIGPPKSSQDRLEVQALQVEESLSPPPVAAEEIVDSDSVQSADTVPTDIAASRSVDGPVAAEPVVESVLEQEQAMAVVSPVAQPRQNVEQQPDTPVNRTGNPELERFFEAGAFVSPSPSSGQIIKTTKHARTVRALRHNELKIRPTPEPDPKEVIDWLLKKKEHYAQ